MNIVFFGSGAFGLPTLEYLAAEHTVQAVVTQPDRPAGRKQRLTPTPIGAWAEKHVETIYKPESVNAPDVIESIRSLKADAWVVIAFGQKLSQALLESRFAINLHASRLPRWRGAAPINHAILAGDSMTGNSVITLADRMDAGLVLEQTEREIFPEHTTGTLHDLLAIDGPAAIRSVLGRHASDSTVSIVQDESEVTLAPKLAKSMGYISFDRTAEEIRRLVHGLNPWPSVTASLRDNRVKLHTVEVTGIKSTGVPGEIVNADRGLVSTADFLMRILTLQPAGKPLMSWGDVANGLRIQDGEAFSRITE